MIGGFEQAQQEYEYKMMCPFDKGGFAYREEDDENQDNYIEYDDIDED